MASAFAPRVRANGGGGGSAFIPRTAPIRRTVSATRQGISTAALSRPATSIPYYDPSRVIDLSRIKVVKDIRAPAEFAEERGDDQTGDNGITGPGSTNGAIAPPRVANGIAPTGTPALTPANLGLLAVAAFLLFGG